MLNGMKNNAILVISDTHGDLSALRLIKQAESFDAVFHLGDIQGDEAQIRSLFEVPVEIVRGNCDLFSDNPTDLILSVHGQEVLLTHGHKYGAKAGMDGLVQAARKKRCNVVLYGHTHIPVVREIDGITLANPGSLTYPRSGIPTYLMITYKENRLWFSIKEL